MSGKCEDCWFWEFRQMDDANERYGRCGHAYQGADEAYPLSDMLLTLEGPEYARRVVYPTLLTHEKFGCVDFVSKE